MTSLALILRELQDRIGLDPTSVGLDTVQWAVRSRVFESQADSLDDRTEHFRAAIGEAPRRVPKSDDRLFDALELAIDSIASASDLPSRPIRIMIDADKIDFGKTGCTATAKN